MIRLVTALRSRLTRHRHCLPEADVRRIIETLGDAVHVLDEHGLLHEARLRAIDGGRK